MNLKYIIIVLIFSCGLFAQEILINIKNCSVKSAKVCSIEGEKTLVVDSLSDVSNSEFRFTFDQSKRHFGFYRLQLNPYRWIDFLYTGDPIEITSDFNALVDSAVVKRSEDNRLFYEFISLQKQYRAKSDLLLLILNRYPKNDGYYESTRKRLQELQAEYRGFVESVRSKAGKKFISRYIAAMQIPLISDTLPQEKQQNWLKANAFNNVDFNDVELIYSDLYSNKSIEYLMYFRNPQLPKELLEKEFMKAIDSILNRAKINQFVYKSIVEYLIDGFKKFGFDIVIDYIVENYVIKDDLCLDSKTEDMIQRRINQASKLKKGTVAPTIELPDSSGSNVALKFGGSERTLVIFYASWCPHCQTMLPEIADYFRENTGLVSKVYAISMDTKREDWLDFIRKKKLKFTHVSDLKGWEGKAVSDYYIYATPSMFLLDKDGKIIAKPVSFAELKMVTESFSK